MPPPTQLWTNWVGNIQHPAPTHGQYYYMPTSAAELQQVLAQRPQGATVRVSGQRHSQPPLVASDNRGSPPPTVTEILIDMSCYKDLGPNHNQNMYLDTTNPQAPVLYVNAGVCEEQVDAYLTANNLMLQTATAGGFFSIGGMTAVDVHGATLQAPIFAETASSFEIMGADGTTTLVNASSPKVTLNGKTWSPLQFTRVSLGGLGIVTRIGLDVLPRPYKTTLQAGQSTLKADVQAEFVAQLAGLVKHTRLEVFYNPYRKTRSNLHALYWDVVDNPSRQTPNSSQSTSDACTNAHDNEWGAGLVHCADLAEHVVQKAQLADSHDEAALIVSIAMMDIRLQMAKAIDKGSELWLSGADYCIFMSYFIPLPSLDADGLTRVWQGLDVVTQLVNKTGPNNFHIAAPMEFRFIQSGSSAMSGTYSTSPTPITFVNLDLIGFVSQGTPASQYPPQLLQFFATVERAWVNMKGFPHNGKMYGFYDPTNPDQTSYTLPFNQNFLAALADRRGTPQQAYNQYRTQCDPNGVFFNQYLRELMRQS